MQWAVGEDRKYRAWLNAERPEIARNPELQKRVGKVLREKILRTNPEVTASYDGGFDARSFAGQKLLLDTALYHISQEEAVNAASVRAKINRDNVRPLVGAMKPSFGGYAAPQRQGDLRGQIAAAERDLALATNQRAQMQASVRLTQLKRAAGQLVA
jgi:hypothetical protein